MTTGLKIRRRFRFCRHNMFGTMSHRGGREIVRATPLGRELMLRTELRIISSSYYKIPGIFEWDAYKQQLPVIRVHLATIHAALQRYKARRVERSLFHFVPKANSVGFWIRSPLHTPPGTQARREALRKWRRRREKRAAVAAAVAAMLNKPMTEHVSSLVKTKMRAMTQSTVLYLAYLVFVFVLSCVIVFV